MKPNLKALPNKSGTFIMTEPLGRKRSLALLKQLLWAAVLLWPAFEAQAGVVVATLHSFHVFTNGTTPTAALVQGSDGSLYGTTSGGGTNGGLGTVFKIGTNGALLSLYSFSGGADGGRPVAGLVIIPDILCNTPRISCHRSGHRFLQVQSSSVGRT